VDIYQIWAALSNYDPEFRNGYTWHAVSTSRYVTCRVSTTIRDMPCQHHDTWHVMSTPRYVTCRVNTTICDMPCQHYDTWHAVSASRYVTCRVSITIKITSWKLQVTNLKIYKTPTLWLCTISYSVTCYMTKSCQIKGSPCDGTLLLIFP
jgi:hypothetical protein